MRIGLITHHEYPTGREIRVTKTAATLKAHGCKITVFCPGTSRSSPRSEFEHGEIVRFRPRLPGIFAKLFAPLPISPLWMWWLLLRFRAAKLDAVIVRDLRLSLPVFFAAKVLGIPAVLDLGEHYPGMMEVFGKQRLVHHLIRGNWLITQLEALSVKLADLVWVVVEENKQRLSRYSSKIEVISNYPASTSGVCVRETTQRRYAPDGDPFTLISLGVIDNIRGLDLAIEAFAIVAADLKNVRMLIYGDGFFREVLEKQVRRLALEDKVHFGGWVAEDRKYEILAQGDIGLLLHELCELTHHTVPNKLFDYMYVGLPVISTRLRPVVQVLDKEKCGIAVDDDPMSVAEGMRSLITDLALRRQCAANGREAVRERYTWEIYSETIFSGVRNLVDDGSVGKRPSKPAGSAASRVRS